MPHKSSQVWKEFEENDISHSAAHYLMAIDKLRGDYGYARSIDIARELDISPGSCSTGLKALIKKWFIVEDKNKFILLSEKGGWLVKKVQKNRLLFYDFFRNTLWAKEEESIVTACKIEHLIPEHVADKLEKFLEK